MNESRDILLCRLFYDSAPARTEHMEEHIATPWLKSGPKSVEAVEIHLYHANIMPKLALVLY